MDYSLPQYKEIIKAAPGHIFKHWVEDGIGCLIRRANWAIAAYLGVPKEHPFCLLNADDIPLRVHGGLTFGYDFDSQNENWPDDYRWYGWDYGHYLDITTRDGELEIDEERKTFWTVEMVEKEIKDAIYDFKKLILMVEKVILKEKGFLIVNEN
jgi:hypothetical protein